MPRHLDKPLAAALVAIAGAGVLSATGDDDGPASAAATPAASAAAQTAPTTTGDDRVATTDDHDADDDHGGDRDRGSDDDHGSDDDGGATTTAPAAGGAPSAAATGAFKDGTYDASGSYGSPAGQESVTVKLTVAKDRVTAVRVTPGAQDGTSRSFQERFVGGISSVVVGKPLDGLQVDKVAGSSLTSGGFNQAVERIRSEAGA